MLPVVGRTSKPRVPPSRSPFIPVTRSRSRERRRATNYKLHVLAVYLHDDDRPMPVPCFICIGRSDAAVYRRVYLSLCPSLVLFSLSLSLSLSLEFDPLGSSRSLLLLLLFIIIIISSCLFFFSSLLCFPPPRCGRRGGLLLVKYASPN